MRAIAKHSPGESRSTLSEGAISAVRLKESEDEKARRDLQNMSRKLRSFSPGEMLRERR